MNGARALVIGASGHIGSAVVRELLARGLRVTAASRTAPASELGALAGVDVALGDADDPGQIARWVRGHDVVVDAAAPYPLHSGSAVDPVVHARERAQAIVDAVDAVDGAGAGCVVACVSSFVTLRRRALLDPADVVARWRRRSHPYFAVKETYERVFVDAMRDGLRALIVNPTTCLGPWDGRRSAAHAFIPRLLRGDIPFASDALINVVDVRDVAFALASLLEHAPLGPVLIAGHDIHVDALARRILTLAAAARPAPQQAPLPLPSFTNALAAVGALALERLSALAPRAAPPLPALLAMLLDEWSPSSLAPSTRAFTFPPHGGPRALDETLADAIAWYERCGARHSLASTATSSSLSATS